MGLEVATYIQDLVATNPLASDKKNQGDDHFRLLKNVLRTNFPNATRAFRFKAILNKSTGPYATSVNDDEAIILCDTTLAPIDIVLPTAGILPPYTVHIVKASFDANPVLVAPASGLIFTDLGGFSLIRLSIPTDMQSFTWVGGSYYRLARTVETPGTILMHAGGVPNGYALANGQDLGQATCPELFLRWGTTFGSGGAGLFKCPNLSDRFIVGAGGSYTVGDVGGANNITLDTSQIPGHTHPHNIAATDSGHLHGTGTGGNAGVVAGVGSIGSGGGVQYVNNGTLSTNVGAANIGISGGVQSAGGGGSHENRPPFFALSYIFRVC